MLTIDPARRLAQSMGLTQLDNTPRPVPGVGAGSGGALFAMMLDMKRTFDEVVEQHADPASAQAILENPFYQSLSSSFAGHAGVHGDGEAGPAAPAAGATSRQPGTSSSSTPRRRARRSTSSTRRSGWGRSSTAGFIRILMAPARAGGRAYMRVFSAGFGVFTNVLSKILGAQLLTDLQTFVSALDTTFGGFRERAERTYTLLQAPGTAFVVVAAPEPDALREASYFVERLAEDDMPLAGLVLNRVHRSQAGDLSAGRSLGAAEQLTELGGHALTAGLLRVHAERMQQIGRERHLVRGFTSAFPDVPVAEAEALASDVHDLDGLRAVSQSLAGRVTGAQRAGGRLSRWRRAGSRSARSRSGPRAAGDATR